MPRTSARNSSERIEMSGFSRPAAAKMSTTPSEATARETIWRIAMSSSSSVPASPAARLASTDRTAWKNATSSRIRMASSWGTASANAWDSSRTARRQRALAVLLREDVLLRRREQARAFGGRAVDPRRVVEAMEQASAHLVLLQHHGNSFGLVQRGTAGAAALGVGRKCAFEFVREAEVVHDEAARLVPEHPVHTGNGLHQPVAAHRLVHVHGVQARGIEAGQPHVPNEHDS